jgi:hypothetical protein
MMRHIFGGACDDAQQKYPNLGSALQYRWRSRRALSAQVLLWVRQFSALMAIFNTHNDNGGAQSSSN